MSDSKTEKKQSSDANRLYGKAMTALREAHKDEFRDLLEKAYSDEGLTYRVRLTAEERAEKEAAERLAKAKAKADALRAEFGDALFEDTPEHLTEPTF